MQATKSIKNCIDWNSKHIRNLLGINCKTLKTSKDEQIPKIKLSICEQRIFYFAPRKKHRYGRKKAFTTNQYKNKKSHQNIFDMKKAIKSYRILLRDKNEIKMDICLSLLVQIWNNNGKIQALWLKRCNLSLKNIATIITVARADAIAKFYVRRN